MKNYQLVRSVDTAKDSGKKLALAFNLGTIASQKYGEAILAGHLLCMIPAGEFPPVDREHIESTNKECIEWAAGIGLVTIGDSYYDKFFKADFARLTAFFIPGVKLENAKLNLHLQMFFFAFDDTMDSIKDFREKGRLDYQTAKEAINNFIKVIDGTHKSLNEIPSCDFPLFKPICKALATIRADAIASNGDISHFVKCIAGYLNAVVWEHSDHSEMAFPSKTEYMFRRNLTIGFYHIIEAINLIRNITLSTEVRSNPLYQLYRQQVCTHVILVNDILSLKKEVANNEINNLILTKQEKLSLKKSFDQVVKEANNLTKDIKKTGSKLKQIFANDENIANFISSMEWFMDGHIYWYENCQRYGKIKFDRLRVEQDDLAYSNSIFQPSSKNPVSPTRKDEVEESIHLNIKAKL